MANSAVAIGTIPMVIGRYENAILYKVSYDTVNTDLTIHTPASTNCVFVLNPTLLEATAANLSFISGANAIVKTYELASNMGFDGKLSPIPEVLFYTNPGEALKIRADAIITSTLGNNFLIPIIETPVLRM